MSGRDAVSGCALRSRHPVTSSGSIITDRDDQGSGRVVHNEREIARPFLASGLVGITQTSSDQQSNSGNRHIGNGTFGKQRFAAELCTALRCPHRPGYDAGGAHITPIALIGAVSIMITWTVVPDNDAKLQRWIGDRAIAGQGQFETDDGLVIGGEST